MRTFTRSLALAAVIATAVAGCAPSPVTGATAAGTPATELTLVGFAVPKAAHDAAQAAFALTDAGAGATWGTSYGASGDQSRAVASGLPADIVHVSLDDDVTRLVDSGDVSATWADTPHGGILSHSVVVLVVREGNPKNITGWDDLLRDDVSIITPNPGSSGSARWNILAAYGSVLANGGTREDGQDYLRGFFANVASLPGSGRDATTAFTAGTGDVLISYENEAILARQHGEPLEYVVPATTLLIENPGVVTTNAPQQAQDYLDFVRSPDGQRIFAASGFRPLDDALSVENIPGAMNPTDPFPQPTTLQTITGDFGGWEQVNATFFGDDGLVTAIQNEAGKN